VTLASTSAPLGAYATDADLHYLRLESGGVVATLVPRGVPHGARAAEAPVFGWDEREMADARGVRFSASPDARPFREHGGRMPDAIVAHGAGLTQIVVGPVHAGIIEPGRFTFSSGGETVVHLDAQLGYAHRGVERFLEGRDALAAAPLVARICGSCSAARSHAYALALERLAGVAVARETAYARVALCELERIYNHLGDLAACASGAGWAPGFTGGLALKERAMRLCAAAGGHRLLFDAIVPGGVATGALADRQRIRLELEGLRRDTATFVAKLFGNSSVASRWHGAGVISREAVEAFGATGPALRACGVPLDVRAFAAYGGYAELSPEVAEHRGGDVFARCAVKRAELAESFRLASIALERSGTLPAALALEVAPGTAYACVEGARGAETIALHVDAGGRIERFHAISASYRTWPLVALAMDGNIVPDFPVVNKSFNLCYACADR
jgi:Ni,Fe-hydrogenase III large subunit